MRFASALVPAKLIRRYKRFLADVEMADGSVINAHVANPGAMTGLQAADSQVWLSRSSNAARKLPYSWELIEVDFGAGRELVGVNTAHPNTIVAEALAAQQIPELAGYGSTRREVKYGKASRVDFVLGDAVTVPAKSRTAQTDCYVEVKNVHLMRHTGRAEFPDSVTARGARHLDELATIAGNGGRAVMLFVVQIGSATSFSLADDIDPAYATAFARARLAGVEALAYTCRVGLDGITLAGRIPIEA